MNARSTQLLLLLVLVALASAIFACVRLNDAHTAALREQQDLVRVRADLTDLGRAHSGALVATPTAGNDPELNRRLRTAASAAGVSEQLSSIEPGQPTRVSNADYLETPVFVRLDSATLRQVVTLLSRLSQDDRAIRVKSIELAPPTSANPATPSAQATGERWTADLTLAYLVYAPKRPT